MRLDDVIQQSGQKEQVLMEAMAENLHVALPGEIVSYNSSNRTATVQPVIRNWRQKETPPLLLDVPVFFPGNFIIPVNKGDECLVVFADTCIDAWYQNSGVSTPISARRHDLSDGFAFVGFFSKKKATGGIDLAVKLKDLEDRIKVLEEGEEE